MERLQNVFLTEGQDRERRTLAQEQGIVLAPIEYLKSLTERYIPSDRNHHSFADPKFLNGLHPNFDK